MIEISGKNRMFQVCRYHTSIINWCESIVWKQQYCNVTFVNEQWHQLSQIIFCVGVSTTSVCVWLVAGYNAVLLQFLPFWRTRRHRVLPFVYPQGTTGMLFVHVHDTVHVFHYTLILNPPLMVFRSFLLTKSQRFGQLRLHVRSSVTGPRYVRIPPEMLTLLL